MATELWTRHDHHHRPDTENVEKYVYSSVTAATDRHSRFRDARGGTKALALLVERKRARYWLVKITPCCC
uniref:Uncharacterized protein n=1 Tax=Knipowitschia caucasica TaxID=637954 RepID=A0AAV2LNC4_KNICA